MNILLIGCVQSSLRFLSALTGAGCVPCGVVTKRESPQNADFADLTPLCRSHGIPFFFYEPGQDAQMDGFIRSRSPDIIYCLGWSHLLKPATLAIPPLGAVGFHPAALPANRGRHPLIWALALGLDRTASSFFQIDAGADTGPVLSQEPVAIAEQDDAATLYAKVMETACAQLLPLTRALEQGTLRPVRSAPGAGNVWRKRSRADGLIDFRMPTRGVCNLVRALAKPYVGASFLCQGREYRVWSARPWQPREDCSNLESGKVLAVWSQTRLAVKTGDGAVEFSDCDPIAVHVGDYLM